MSPSIFRQFIVLALAASVAIEVTLLAGIFQLGSGAYHGLHLLLMAALAGALLLQFRWARTQGNAAAASALLLAAGALSTGIGDYVNGALSGVSPVSLKLTWALLLFGIGYSLYVGVLWQAAKTCAPGNWQTWRWLLPLLILTGNVLAWFNHVEANVADHALLYYGSFAFNATLYVALPTLALWFWAQTGRTPAAMIVLVGTVFIPWSDLVLFDSWLRGQDPDVPAFELYALNWILYFGGQALFATLPSLLIERER
jgi:hypothetical protein